MLVGVGGRNNIAKFIVTIKKICIYLELYLKISSLRLNKCVVSSTICQNQLLNETVMLNHYIEQLINLRDIFV